MSACSFSDLLWEEQLDSGLLNAVLTGKDDPLLPMASPPLSDFDKFLSDLPIAADEGALNTWPTFGEFHEQHVVPSVESCRAAVKSDVAAASDEACSEANSNGSISGAPSPLPPPPAPPTRAIARNRDDERRLFGYLNRGGKSAAAPERPSRVASRAPSGHGDPNSRQAVYARQYRQKNKAVVDDLQSALQSANDENNCLRAESKQLKTTILDLKQEIVYLRGVLVNDSQLAPLIRCVAENSAGSKLQFPLESASKRKSAGGDAPVAKRTRHAAAAADADADAAPPPPGVCLHMRDGELSVEFCGACNRQARCVDVE